MSKQVITYEGDGLYVLDVNRCNTFSDLESAVINSETLTDSVLELWDMSEIDIDLTYGEIARLADAAKAKKHRPHKSAVVASGDLAFGLMRIFSAYGSEAAVEIEVFRTLEEARRWLLADQSPI